MAPDAKARPSWVCSSISVVVRAENEDDQKYEWSECLPVSDPVKKLADAWAEAHGVPPSAVGFDDANGCEVDLLQTPLSLGWVPGSEVVLTAFPTEDRFMEQIANEGEDGEDDAPAPTPGGDSGALVLETPVKKVPSPKQVQGQPWNPQSVPSEDSPVTAPVRREAASGATASSDLRRPAPLVEVEPAPALRSAARGASAEGNNNGSHSRARGQQEPRKEPRRSRGGGARGAGSPAGRGRGAAAAPADGGSRGRGAPAADGSVRGRSAAAVAKAAAAKAPASQIDSASTPTEEEAIVFEQANPKKEGSSAYQRYERYKRARTVSEALVLGAAKGDIAHDFKRGFLKRRRGG